MRHNSTKTKFNKATQNYLQRLGVSTDKKMKGLERRHTLHGELVIYPLLQSGSYYEHSRDQIVFIIETS